MSNPLALAVPEATWSDVPTLVTTLHAEVAPRAAKIAAALDAAGVPPTRVYLDRLHGGVHVWDHARPASGAEALAKLAAYSEALGPEHTVGYSVDRPRFDAHWLLIKGAAFLQGPADAMARGQALLGGPHPLAAAIVGGALGAGLGYGGGYLAEKVLGDTVEPGRLRHNAALLGAGLGAIPGAWWGAVNMRHPEHTGGGLGAWTNAYPFRTEDLKEVQSAYDDLGVDLPETVKQAIDDSAAGALFLPTIPVDAFNRAIWQDVHAAPNPYGTRDPYETGDAPLHTPPPVAAAASGIVAGAAAATGRQAVSPWTVALTAAATAGKGYLGGLALGKTLGALAGLRPEVQAKLQQAGLWGGLVTGAVNGLFGS